MSRSRLLLTLASFATLSGCADYLNHYEGVTLAAGDTQKQNMLLQTKNPFNPDSQNVAIDTNGRRAADAVRNYEASQSASASQGGGGEAVSTGGDSIGTQ